MRFRAEEPPARDDEGDKLLFFYTLACPIPRNIHAPLSPSYASFLFFELAMRKVVPSHTMQRKERAK
jgi:hypothetical protein